MIGVRDGGSAFTLLLLAATSLGCHRQTPAAGQPIEPATAQPVRCFEVVQWLEPEICDWAAYVHARGCFEGSGVAIDYSFDSRMPCTPEQIAERGEELRYGHRDLDWAGTLEGAWPSEFQRLLTPDPDHPNSGIFVTIESLDGETQTWNGTDTDWRPLLRELDHAATRAVGLDLERSPKSLTLGSHDAIETFEVAHDPSTCTVTLVHRQAGATSSCVMPLSAFHALVPDADAWSFLATHLPQLRARLREAARCE